MQYLSIQYLRAIAALAVIAHHTAWVHTEIGAAGVDLFFVISGFVMALVTERGTEPLAFLRSRALRLVPLYWLLTLLAAVLSHAGLQHTVLSLLFWPHDEGNGQAMPVIWQGWTLNYEVFFYAVFAGVLALPARWRPGVLTTALLWLTAVGFVLEPQSKTGVVYTSPMLLEFLAGVWICRWRDDMPAAALALGVALFGVLATLPYPGDGWRAVVWGMPSALIVAGCIGLERGGSVPCWPALRLLGDASYSIYLVQSFTVGAAMTVFKPLPAPLAVAGVCAVCAAAGLAVYFGVERPMTRWLKGGRQVAAAILPLR